MKFYFFPQNSIMNSFFPSFGKGKIKAHFSVNKMILANKSVKEKKMEEFQGNRIDLIKNR